MLTNFDRNLIMNYKFLTELQISK